MKEALVPIVVIFALVVLVVCIVLPIAYLDGQAKAAYLKLTRGIDIPWYQATFLDVSVNNINAEVQNK